MCAMMLKLRMLASGVFPGTLTPGVTWDADKGTSNTFQPCKFATIGAAFRKLVGGFTVTFAAVTSLAGGNTDGKGPEVRSLQGEYSCRESKRTRFGGCGRPPVFVSLLVLTIGLHARSSVVSG